MKPVDMIGRELATGDLVWWNPWSRFMKEKVTKVKVGQMAARITSISDQGEVSLQPLIVSEAERLLVPNEISLEDFEENLISCNGVFLEPNPESTVVKRFRGETFFLDELEQERATMSGHREEKKLPSFTVAADIGRVVFDPTPGGDEDPIQLAFVIIAVDIAVHKGVSNFRRTYKFNPTGDETAPPIVVIVDVPGSC